MTTDWVEVNVNWQGDLQFSAVNKDGCTVEFGYKQGQPGVSPMELLLVGLAGCTGMDVISILKKKRQTVTDFRVRVRAKRADSHPKVYTKIELVYLFWGTNITDKGVTDAIKLSKEKYCSASVMLGKAAEITYTYEINPEESGSEITKEA